MNMILDVTRVLRRLLKGQTLTGIDRVTLAYIHYYHQTASALVRWKGKSWVLPPAQSRALFAWVMMPTKALAVTKILIQSMFSIGFQLLNDVFSGIKTGDSLPTNNTFLINTGHLRLDQADYMYLICKRRFQLICFVHDLIPLVYPEYCHVGEDTRHRVKMNYILDHATAIITNSEATRHHLMQYAVQTNRNMPVTEVALLASGIAVSFVQRPRVTSQPYFVILSTIEPRKNHLLLLHVWRSLSERFGEQTPHLFVIGKRGWECEQVFDLLDRSPSLKTVVTEIPRCHDADLVTYIQYSQALLFPSFVEGYGLPVVEALSLGVPVIASDLAVFREIAGDIPEYLDPLDGQRWGQMIMEYAKSASECRAAQIKRIQSFKAPTWEQHFSKVDALLHTLVE